MSTPLHLLPAPEEQSGVATQQRARFTPLRSVCRGLGAAACRMGRLVGGKKRGRGSRRRGAPMPPACLSSSYLPEQEAADGSGPSTSSLLDSLFSALAALASPVDDAPAFSSSYVASACQPAVATTSSSPGCEFPLLLTPAGAAHAHMDQNVAQSMPHSYSASRNAGYPQGVVDGGRAHDGDDDGAASGAVVHVSSHRHDPRSSHSQQRLIAIGSRQWGNWWDGRGLLKVRIYDFAVYVDPAQARQALGLQGRWRGSRRRQQRLLQSGVAEQVKAANHVGMSLTIRASRNLPLPMLSQEFERILQRRHEKIGGSNDDPALREVLTYFSRDRLPSSVLQGDAVRKGAAITFSRSSGGALVTEAGGEVVGRVLSPKVCEALFDLYLGEQPVSRKAKAAAADALVRMMKDTQHHYQPQQGERLLCSSPDDPSTCIITTAH